MQKLQTKKEITVLTVLFMLTYMVSYITRINFGAVISEIESSESISRSLLSMAVTGSFITYGVGQIFSGIISDRFSPKRLVSLGFAATVLMNILIPLCRSAYLMTAVWCVNGFAQSLMWPPIVRLMTAYLTKEDYKTVTVKVLRGSSLGTVAVYIISPLLISALGWRSVFIFAAVSGAVILLFWNALAPDIKRERVPAVPKSRTPKLPSKIFFTPVMLCVMPAIAFHGMLKDGVTTWMPSYISETYGLSSSISILSGVVLPLFSIVSVQLASILYRRVLKKPLTCAGAIFCLGCAASALLLLCSDRSAAVSVALSAVLTGCMHGVNLIFVGMLPAYFEKFGNVSTATGVLNACTYLGSAVSTYGIALLSESLGWSFTIVTWTALAALGTALCLISSKAWERKFGEK